MDRDQLAMQVAAATVAAWLAGFAKVLHRGVQERRRINWTDVLLETPAAIVCGCIGGGIAVAIGQNHPLTVAAAGAIAGHLGAPLMSQLAIEFLRRRHKQPDQKNDAGPP